MLIQLRKVEHYKKVQNFDLKNKTFLKAYIKMGKL